jgi:excisionase family DNA binding protein
MYMSDDLITVGQAARILGNTVQHVRLLARTGQLRANKVGRDWIIDREAVTGFKLRREATPLIAFQKRGRRRTASMNETKAVHSAQPITTGIPGRYLSPQLIESVADNGNYLPLSNLNARQLEMGGIGEISVLKECPATQTTQIDPRNRLNDLTATQWLPETVSVWVQKGLGASHPDAQIERQHPAPFSFTDVTRLIRFFTKRNAVVLDPFVGIGSTLKACALQERIGIGIELNPKYVELTRERLARELPHNVRVDHNQRIIQGDARVVLPTLLEDTVDLVVTSPPYGYILHKEDHKARQERIANGLDTRYSDDPCDLGNIRDYNEFLGEVAKVLGGCGRVLKPKKYMAVIVSDYRHGSKYVMFHADLVRALEPYDFSLRGITVLYQRHKRVFPYGYPFSYVPNIHHQLILIMQNEKHK